MWIHTPPTHFTVHNMADVLSVADAGLEQRDRKRGKPDDSHADDVPDFAAAEDFGNETPAEEEAPVDVEGGGDTTAAEEEGPSTKLYFVRIPRPPVNDEEIKKLTVSFQEHVAKVKVSNGKLSNKRVSACVGAGAGRGARHERMRLQCDSSGCGMRGGPLAACG